MRKFTNMLWIIQEMVYHINKEVAFRMFEKIGQLEARI